MCVIRACSCDRGSGDRERRLTDAFFLAIHAVFDRSGPPVRRRSHGLVTRGEFQPNLLSNQQPIRFRISDVSRENEAPNYRKVNAPRSRAPLAHVRDTFRRSISTHPRFFASDRIPNASGDQPSPPDNHELGSFDCNSKAFDPRRRSGSPRKIWRPSRPYLGLSIALEALCRPVQRSAPPTSLGGGSTSP